MHQNGEHHHHHGQPFPRLKSFPVQEKPILKTLSHHHVPLKMQPPQPPLTLDPVKPRRTSRSLSRSSSRSASPSPAAAASDPTAVLSDELLLLVFSHLPPSARDFSAALVCRRWLRLSGCLRRALTLRRWDFLNRLVTRFPNLADLNLTPAAFASNSAPDSARVLLSRGSFSIHMDQLYSANIIGDLALIDSDSTAQGLETVAKGCRNLCKLTVADAVETGLLAIADACHTLLEMELHRCSDLTLRSISGFKNLQILKLVGSVEGLYSGPGVSDIGLTILAHGCKRLVKLDLSGCEGSYDGISAIGRCCLMLEELTICNHRMDSGWMAGLSFCGNLKTLRLQSCRKIDDDPGPLEHLGSCQTIERIQMQRCQLRDKRSLRALFTMCELAREIIFQNCWGLDNEMFGLASICRGVRLLSLEGCSQLTTEGLESLVLTWSDLKSLTVVSCNNVRDEAVSPALSNLFTILKEFKWRPDSKSVLAVSLAGTGMGRKGGRFFKRA